MILGLIEHDQGTMNKNSLEMLTLARDLASDLDMPLQAVLIGPRSESLASPLSAYGVTEVVLVQHEQLTDYAPIAWARSLAQLAETKKAQVVMAAGSDRGNEVMAHLAAQVDLPLATNCIEVKSGDPFSLTRVRWGGSLLEEATLAGSMKLLTVAPLALPAEENPTGSEVQIEAMTPTLTEADLRVQITGRTTSEAEGISLGDADVVVGGGRGVGSAEGFAILDELADLLNGAVGSSRSATNLGWRAHADQIGQTGTRIAPDIYIACGISGAIQHMVGCKGSKRLLAINTDPDAPIVAKADYAIIADLHQVVPALIAEIKREKGA